MYDISTVKQMSMGYGWSYSDYLNGQTQQSEVEASKPKEKGCRCDSHYLFAFGHEKQCDHYKEKK